MPFRTDLVCAVGLVAAAGLGASPLQQELLENREGVRYTPELVPATAQRIETLEVPSGFTIGVFASDLGNPRMLALGPDGTVFVTRPASGDVVALRDRDGDGRAEARSTVIDGLPGAHGIAVRDDRIYVATVDAIYSAPLEGQRAGLRTTVVDGMPPGGRHPNRTLAFGPDGQLYVTIGSTCNLCLESSPLSATIARVNGGALEVFASGLRNTLGIAWHPRTGEMWGMDNGADWLGNAVPPEELNRLTQGGDYGWPFLYGENTIVELTDYPQTFEPLQAKRTAVPAVAGHTAHAAPMQFVFYTGTAFPAEYRHDAFVAMRGSWNRRPPSGYELVRIRFEAGGQPGAIEPFVTGFLSAGGSQTFARPVGVLVTADGALLLGDDANGVIYRIAATRKRRRCRAARR